MAQPQRKGGSFRCCGQPESGDAVDLLHDCSASSQFPADATCQSLKHTKTLNEY